MKRTLTVTVSAPPELDDNRVALLVSKLLAGGAKLYADVVDDDRRQGRTIVDELDALKLSGFGVMAGATDRFKGAVEGIRSILWETPGGWDPGKEWDSETIEYVAGVLEDLGLRPVCQP